MTRHRIDARRLKIHRSYTVDEAARTLAIAKGTVRRWLKHGLAATDERKPALIRGSELIGYLAARRKPKQACPPGQCFCVKCKASRVPDGAMAEFIVITPTTGNLRALCPACGTLMHRRTSVAQLRQIQSSLDIAIVEAASRLRDAG